jgi:hypothetical protein
MLLASLVEFKMSVKFIFFILQTEGKAMVVTGRGDP